LKKQERVSGVAQGVDPEFKPQYHKKKKEKKKTQRSKKDYPRPHSRSRTALGQNPTSLACYLLVSLILT
jgi:hypothetical protein